MKKERRNTYDGLGEMDGVVDVRLIAGVGSNRSVCMVDWISPAQEWHELFSTPPLKVGLWSISVEDHGRERRASPRRRGRCYRRTHRLLAWRAVEGDAALGRELSLTARTMLVAGWSLVIAIGRERHLDLGVEEQYIRRIN